MLLHVWLAMAMTHQWWLFVLQSHSPPYSYLQLLDDPSPSAVQRCRDVHNLFVRLEADSSPAAIRWRDLLFQRTWPVVREPLWLLEAANWTTSPAVFAYLEAIWPGAEHSLAEENAFNVLRDDEQRSARHKQRGPVHLSALSITSSAARYSGFEQVEPAAEDFAQFTDVTVKTEVFTGASAVKSNDYNAEPSTITRPGVAPWPSTSVDAFTQVQCSGLQAPEVVGE